MAHESFEDEEIGAIVNENFVAIKVDREERPDVDAVYMSATQAMTGQGGWPMTVFATPDGKPFFCGTYYPPGAFRQLLHAVADSWRNQRDQVLAQGSQVVEAIAGTPAAASGAITGELMSRAAAGLLQAYDRVNGGFGGAPKFPPHMNLLFLLRYHERTGDQEVLEVARHTLEAMARGGIYDQVGGGFHRYAVDETWTVPHFEKMLYDNALLLRVYTEGWRRTEDLFLRRVAAETAEFLWRDLGTAEGGFASALDADTDGVEGLTYAWTPAQLRQVLGAGDGAWAADLLGVTEAGTFESGTSVLQLMRDLDDVDEAVRARWARVRAALATARARRTQPARDDKIVAAWNGLAIVALCEYAQVDASESGARAGDAVGIAVREAADVAIRAGELLARVHLVDGELRRVSRDGVAGDPQGVLEDYGCVAAAFCALHQLTGEGLWLARAGELIDAALSNFTADAGAFYDTAAGAEQLITRPADPTDNATPSGQSAIVDALITFSALTGKPEYRQRAAEALGTVSMLLAKHARFAGYAATAAEALLGGPMEIAIAVSGEQESDLVETARQHAPAGSVIVSGTPDQPGVPLLAGRPLIGGQPTAYVCRGFVCDRPVTTSVDLLTILRHKA